MGGVVNKIVVLAILFLFVINFTYAGLNTGVTHAFHFENNVSCVIDGTTGTITGATYENPPSGGFDYQDPLNGTALYFDGDYDYVRFTKNLIDNVNTKAFTISGWYMGEQSNLGNDENTLYSEYNGGQYNFYFQIETPTNNYLYIRHYNSSNTGDLTVISDSKIEYADGWVNFIITCNDNKECKYYKNGVLDKEYNHTRQDGRSLYSWIGTRNGGAGDFIEGWIDEYTFWNRSLLPQEAKYISDNKAIYPFPNVDFDAPIINFTSIDGNLLLTTILENSAPLLNIQTDENATCKFSLDDINYTNMDNICHNGIETTNHYCQLNELINSSNRVYVSCKDDFNNYGDVDYTFYVNNMYINSLVLNYNDILDDSYVSQSNPTTNYGSNSNLIVTDESNDKYSIIKFNLSDLFVDDIYSIKQVNLSLNAWTIDLDVAGETIKVNTHKVFNNYSWDESVVNWNNKPTELQDYNNNIESTYLFSNGDSTGWIELDVTSIIKNCYDNNESVCSIYLTTEGTNTESGDNIYFHSSESTSTSLRPSLNVNYKGIEGVIEDDSYTNSSDVNSSFGLDNNIIISSGVTESVGYFEINTTNAYDGELYWDVWLNVYYNQMSINLNSIIDLYYCNDEFNENNLTYFNNGTEIINCDIEPFGNLSYNESINQFEKINIEEAYNKDDDGLFIIKLKPRTSTTGTILSIVSINSITNPDSQPFITFGEKKVLADYQPALLYYNNFNNGNASITEFTNPSGWFVNSDGQAQGYNTWAFYLEDFIDEKFPEYNNDTEIRQISFSWSMAIGSDQAYQGLGLTSGGTSSQREYIAIAPYINPNVYIRRYTSTVTTNKLYFNKNEFHDWCFSIKKTPSTDFFYRQKDGGYIDQSSISNYETDFHDFVLYRLLNIGSGGQTKIDDLKIWDNVGCDEQPELRYVTPSPTLTILIPNNNTQFNNSFVNITYQVVDEDSSILECELLLNNISVYNENVSNSTINTINLNITSDGVYNFSLECEDENNNIINSGIYNMSVITCFPNWQPQYGSCQTNDYQLKTYSDLQSCNSTLFLPIDNGSTVACNYCSEDITSSQTTCQWNGSDFYQTTSYMDNNYYSCCAVTTLLTDCSIEYNPYNDSIYDLCVSQENDFEIEYDEQALYGLAFDEKVYWKFYINETNMTEDYKCISYVKHMADGVVGELIQVNPVYTKQTKNLITTFGVDNKYDSREYFKTIKGLGNVYFTKENLIFDTRQYLFGVQCTGNGKKLNSERVVTTEYEKLNSPITYWFWLQSNITTIITGIILFIIVSIIVGYLIFTYRRNIQWRD